MMLTNLPEWTYEPSGDVDGDPRYDGRAGLDHFVMEGGIQLGCPPDEDRARLMAAAPKLLRAALAVLATWGTQDEDVAIEARNLTVEAIDSALGPR